MKLLIALLGLLLGQVHNKPPGSVELGAVQVTDSTVARTLRSSRTPPGTELEWTVRATAGDVNVWTGLPTNLIVAADTLPLRAKNTSWDGDSTRFCAEVWNRKGSSRSTTSQSLCWWEKKPTTLPPPGPITVDSVPADTTTPTPPTGLLFSTRWANGAKPPSQNGVSITGGSCSPSDADGAPYCPLIVPDPGNSSGYSMRFRYKGNATLSDDAWSEQNFKVPGLAEVFLCIELVIPANYIHRDDPAGPDNNKGLRVWGGVTETASRDESYSNSAVKAGFSTLPFAGQPRSQLITEFGTAESATGQWGTGPWTELFAAGQVVRIGLYAKAGSTAKTEPPTNSTMTGAPNDGTIKVWRNGTLMYNRSDLRMFTPGTPNKFYYGYILGWSNSGFTADTDILLRWFAVSIQPIPECLQAA